MMDAAREAVTREARLAAENAQLEARNGELQAQNEELHAHNGELHACLQQQEGENWELVWLEGGLWCSGTRGTMRGNEVG